MGLRAEIYRYQDRNPDPRRGSFDSDCSAGSISSKFDRVTLVNIPASPDKPAEDAPAVELRAMHNRARPEFSHVYAVPVGAEHGMFGGNYIATSDSRLGQAVSKLAGHPHHYPVPLHDRIER